MEVNEGDEVMGFEEKPEEPKTIPGDPEGILASMGVYIFNTEILVRRLIEDARSDSTHDFGKDIIPAMIKKDRVFAFDFRKGDQGGMGYWRDVGTIDAYFEANMDLVSVTPQLNLYDPQWPILTYQPPYPPAKTVLEEEGRMGTALNSILSNGCIISGGSVKRSVLIAESDGPQLCGSRRFHPPGRGRYGKACKNPEDDYRQGRTNSSEDADRLRSGGGCETIHCDGVRHCCGSQMDHAAIEEESGIFSRRSCSIPISKSSVRENRTR